MRAQPSLSRLPALAADRWYRLQQRQQLGDMSEAVTAVVAGGMGRHSDRGNRLRRRPQIGALIQAECSSIAMGPDRSTIAAACVGGVRLWRILR